MVRTTLRRRPTEPEVPTGSGRAGPVRTCVGCRRRAHPDGLVRLTRRPDGSLAVGKGPGRGAWLCGPPETVTCLETAIGRRGLERALRGPVTEDTIERLRTTLRE